MVMTNLSRPVLTIAMAALLAACSFRPLYGTSTEGNAAREGIAQISVAEIGPGRIGQQVRNGLLDRLTPKGTPAFPTYHLEVLLSESLVDLLVQENSTVLRRNYKLTARYKLIDLATGDQIFSATAARTASLNRLDSEYANVIAQRDAEKRAADAVAGVISQRIGIALAELASPEQIRKAAIAEAAKIKAAPQPSATPPEPMEMPLSPPSSRNVEVLPEPVAAASDEQRFPDPVAIESTP